MNKCIISINIGSFSLKNKEKKNEKSIENDNVATVGKIVCLICIKCGGIL